MSARRGFTLIELMISVVIMIVAIAACTLLLLAAVRLDRSGEQRVESGDRGRIALADIIDSIDRTGLGAPQGVLVNYAGTPKTIFPIFGIDGTTGQGAVPTAVGATMNGTDDLWLIMAQRTGLGESCVDRGAQVPLTNGIAAGSGQALPVTCTSSFVAGDLLLAASQGSGALLTGTTLPSGSTVGFAEAAIGGFAPSGTGFRIGDTLMTVTLVHYYIAPNPKDPGHTALWKASGVLGNDAYARPFVDQGQTVVADDIEDLQVAFGYDPANLGNPDQYTFTPGLSPLPASSVAAANLRAVRVSVVARGHFSAASDSVGEAGLKPLTVENHVPGGGYDGMVRTVVTRRVELANLSPGSI